ncbi:hypothetical protein SAMD00019534_068310 [Acytostelium subglobosum LB1]|uniref:hypothetical protein n=1 Tax=Acytostelium subglobosum LB1 TaxID=1410327 RepID=UPI000644BFCE|nr:hypothetical protein SAMD00019534_068310 [Acytostelium subglobosum LB1]GAM23656.1 hypothetical protein SAMD00019534_068310 [Acytostelium subglobosum LB1]|eukprot:XP_012753397.1 hypothetical protein SAMD00019534_068310 [Acytostelium subglobosum LB1]
MALIQVTPTQDETDRLMTMAAKSNGKISGLVGWCDITDGGAEAVANLQERYKKSIINDVPLLVGLCPMLEGIQQDWLTSLILRPVIKYMIEKKIVFEARVRHDNVHLLAKFAKQYPKLTVVLDHISKPRDHAQLDAWRKDLKILSKQSKNVYCKMSGMYCEVTKDFGRNLDMAEVMPRVAPMLNHMIKCFGSKRLMWSSDCPAAIRTHQEWNNFTSQCFEGLTTNQLIDIFFGNASKIYTPK